MTHLPPQRRTPAGARLAEHADGVRLVLPRCGECGTVQYPLRERCRHCLGDALAWEPVPAEGTLLSWTRLYASVEPFFRDHLPWTVGRVKLACGPVIIVHLGIPEPVSGMAVHVTCAVDAGGAAVLLAMAPGEQAAIPAGLAALLPAPSA